MSIGTTIRALLGPKLFSKVGRRYRSLFVNLDTVARILSDEIPIDGHVVDVGGGDGEPLNHLLSLRPDLCVTMTDIIPDIGSMIKNEYRQRVTLLPEMSLKDFTASHSQNITAVIISDVIHHIPVAERRHFFLELVQLLTESFSTLFIKDVEPGYLISYLGYLSDRYITGDSNTALISKANVKNLIEELAPATVVTELSLFEKNRPNYLIKIEPKPPL